MNQNEEKKKLLVLLNKLKKNAMTYKQNLQNLMMVMLMNFLVVLNQNLSQQKQV